MRVKTVPLEPSHGRWILRGLIRFRSFRMPSKIPFCVIFVSVSSTGMSTAAGAPRLVIVLFLLR